MATRTAQQIWDTALGELQIQVSKANYRTWLEKTSALSYKDNQLIVSVPNTFVAEYLDKNLRSLIEKTLIGITQSEIKVSITVENPDRLPEAAPVHQGLVLAHLQPTANLTRLNPKYTFDNFVVSKCNQLPYAAALGAAEKPGLANYNPLYLYGGVGLGKTHLLNAMGNLAAARGMMVVYASAEQFTNDFVSAIRERRTGDFRNKYRNADMLLIDDIQFISGKQQTEESFFHIFNELRDADRQIAVTSNCPPGAIPAIEDRLRSRLEWGLTTGIQLPDFETRLAILQNKAEKDGVNLPQDVLEFIAQRVKQNIRELKGSLNRVNAYSRLLGTMVTPELAEEALKDIATRQTTKTTKPNLIVETVAQYFDLEAADLKSKKRDKSCILARQIAMYLMREQTDFSLASIGLELGGRQPIVVSQAHKKITSEIGSDLNLKQKIYDIQQRLTGNREHKT